MKYIITCVACFSLSSCSTLFFGPDPTGSPQEVFNYFVKEVEDRYSLFGTREEIDWNILEHRYRAMLHDSMTDEELFEVIGGLAEELEDGHVNIKADWDFSRNWNWYLDYPANFNFNIVERNYLGKNYRRTGPFLVTMIDSFAYVYYESFSPQIDRKAVSSVFEYIQPAKGLIFDIRMNGGGKLSNTRLLASYLADTVRTVLKFYYKSGPGENDFDGPFDYVVKPQKENTFTKPVVLLVNRKSYSAATFFPAITTAYPHITIMGDTTGGGGGIPYHFELPNGWDYRFSVSKTFDSNGRNIEKGIPPDINAELKPEDEAKGVDSIIEEAIRYLEKRTTAEKE